MGERSGEQTIQDVAGEDVAEKPLLMAVCVPDTNGKWHSKFGECLASMVTHFTEIARTGDKIEVISKSGPIMPEVRHRCIGEAMLKQATHIMMLAPNMSFPKDSLERLLNRNKHAVGVNYLRDYKVREFAAYRNGITVKPDPAVPEVENVDGVALGMVLFNTTVFDAIKLPFFKYKQIGDTPGFCEDYIHFWKLLSDEGIECFIDHELSTETRNLEYDIVWH
jgi:hypothetical protein